MALSTPNRRVLAIVAVAVCAGLVFTLLPWPFALAAVMGVVAGAAIGVLARSAPAPDTNDPHAALRDRIARIARGEAPAPDAGEPSSEGDLSLIERRLLDAAAREAEDRRHLLALFDGVDAPVVSTDAEGNVTLCNRAAERLVGAPALGLLGRPVHETFTQADLLRLHAAARAGRAGQELVRIARPGGVAVYEASAVPITGGEGRDRFAVVMTLRDVTELSRAVQVKSDFVANASHELRTPIAAIRMAVETLQSEASDDPAMREKLLGVLESNTTRLEEMVRDLLDLSRLESPDAPLRIAPVPASELGASLASLFEAVCRERGLTLVLDFSPELESMRTDRELVLVILKNLVENATRFAYENTEVRVVGRPAGGDSGGVRFAVIDRGIGIPLGQQQRIFERYYQVDPARTGGPRRGTGLGLSIVKHAVRTLGGSVRVQSVWKQGTTMTVELPGVLPAAGQALETNRRG